MADGSAGGSNSKAGGSIAPPAADGPSCVDGGSESPDGSRIGPGSACMAGEHAGDGIMSMLLSLWSSSELDASDACGWTKGGWEAAAM